MAQATESRKSKVLTVSRDRYVIDEEGLVEIDTDDDRHDARLAESHNPFRQATFLGFRFQHSAFDRRNPRQQIEEPTCLVRLGADYVGFTDDMLDTLQSEFGLDQLSLGGSMGNRATEQLHVMVQDFVKPTRAVPTTPARMKALLDYSPPAGFLAAESTKFMSSRNTAKIPPTLTSTISET